MLLDSQDGGKEAKVYGIRDYHLTQESMYAVWYSGSCVKGLGQPAKVSNL